MGFYDMVVRAPLCHLQLVLTRLPKDTLFKACRQLLLFNSLEIEDAIYLQTQERICSRLRSLPFR